VLRTAGAVDCRMTLAPVEAGAGHRTSPRQMAQTCDPRNVVGSARCEGFASKGDAALDEPRVYRAVKPSRQRMGGSRAMDGGAREAASNEANGRLVPLQA